MVRSFQVVAHRGCRSLYPENTLEGFRKAISLAKKVVVAKESVVKKEPTAKKSATKKTAESKKAVGQAKKTVTKKEE